MREIIVILLLLLAILLVLGIFLYDYIPTSKIVPKVEAYQPTQSVKNALQENVVEKENQTVITYEINDKDLKIYTDKKDYDKGKANPFSTIQTNTTNTTTNTVTTTSNVSEQPNNTTDTTQTNTTTNNTTQTNTSNPDATGNYFENTGIK